MVGEVKQDKKFDFLAWGMWIVLLILAFLYPPIRWFALCLLIILFFFIALHKKLNGWELSVTATLLGISSTILIWVMLDVIKG
jgi:hypothetical protein